MNIFLRKIVLDEALFRRLVSAKIEKENDENQHLSSSNNLLMVSDMSTSCPSRNSAIKSAHDPLDN